MSWDSISLAGKFGNYLFKWLYSMKDRQIYKHKSVEIFDFGLIMKVYEKKIFEFQLSALTELSYVPNDYHNEKREKNKVN